jgi:hypothetical protein
MMKTTKNVFQLFIALFLGMVLSVSCDPIDPDNPLDPDDPNKPGNSTVMTFIGTAGADPNGDAGQYTQTPCFITWEKGKQPTIELIEGIILGYGDHPNKSGQAGKYMLVYSNKESVRFDYHKKGTWTGGTVPFLIDLETLEWTYLPHIKGSKSEKLFVNMKDFYVSPDGKKVFYEFSRCFANSEGGPEDNNAQDGIVVYDVDSKETAEVNLQGLLDAVEFKPTYKDPYGMDKPYGWYLSINCITPDSKTLIGTIRYHLAYAGFGGWQGGSTKLFRYDIPTDKFDLIVGDSEGTPSFISILNDNETLYFCNFGYGFSHNFKYNLKTRKVTSLSKEYGGMTSLAIKNHMRIGNDGNLQGGTSNNNFYYKDNGNKVEVVEFKNLPYWHQNSLQLNKSRTKVYALITTKKENYYVELQSIDAEAPVDTLFTLPSNVGNLMQIW